MATALASLCNRCLVVVDARESIRAQWENDDGTHGVDIFRTPTYMPDLIKWAEKHIHRKKIHFDMYAWDRVLVPVATYYGDPVCEMHLIHLVELERKREYQVPRMR